MKEEIFTAFKWWCATLSVALISSQYIAASANAPSYSTSTTLHQKTKPASSSMSATIQKAKDIQGPYRLQPGWHSKYIKSQEGWARAYRSREQLRRVEVWQHRREALEYKKARMNPHSPESLEHQRLQMQMQRLVKVHEQKMREAANQQKTKVNQ